VSSNSTIVAATAAAPVLGFLRLTCILSGGSVQVTCHTSNTVVFQVTRDEKADADTVVARENPESSSCPKLPLSSDRAGA
jgi:hypothetical protein